MATGGYYLGGIFDPVKDSRIRALNNDPSGIAGQAASFAASEQERVRREQQAIVDANAAAEKAQAAAEKEAARQQQLQASERQDAINLAQQKLQQQTFAQQQESSQAAFNNQLELLRQQEAMRQAQQALPQFGSGGSQRQVSNFGNGAPQGNVFSDMFYNGPTKMNGLDAYNVSNRLSQSLGGLWHYDPSRGQFFNGKAVGSMGNYNTSGQGVLGMNQAGAVASSPNQYVYRESPLGYQVNSFPTPDQGMQQVGFAGFEF